MNNTEERNLFRLAAVLYADDNYNISNTQLHRKILENALFEMKAQDWVDVSIVGEFIQSTYKLVFTDDEIWRTANNTKFIDKIFRVFEDGKEKKISLSPERIEVLNQRINLPTIFSYIDEFCKLNQLEYENTRDLISNFLYTVFTQNVENFKRLLNNQSLCDIVNSGVKSISEEGKKIINSFLNWDNEDKNKAIFRIASYALEYCMLTNDKNTAIDLDSLRNKRFYLDTNIIYRVLGINGELRKNRTISLLNKFNAISENLFISKVTDSEFKNSINHHISQIERNESPAINAQLYLDETIDNGEFYRFYQQWRLHRPNPSLSLFKAFLLSEYEDFKKRFKIEVEVFSPYDITTEGVIKVLDEYKHQIASYKPLAYDSQIKHDAENVLWIESLMPTIPENIYDAKAFLLSSDHRLQQWDYSRSAKVPVVLLPSQWLSIVLRFMERTNDDYYSFVSFLNLPIQERLLNEEQLYAILSGIGQITTDSEQQRNILKHFIAERTEKALSQEKSDTLKEQSKIFAKSELQLQVEEISKSLEDTKSSLEIEKENSKQLKTEFENHTSETDRTIQELRAELSKAKDDLLSKNAENVSLRNAIVPLLKWKNTAILIFKGILILLMILLCLLVFFFHNWEYNYIHQLFVWLNNFEEIERNIGVGIIIFIYGGAFLWLVSNFWKQISTKH
ncbi:hypothetical protein HDR65_03785 [bacterium]|nr:hypothetical protein [bacterium]